jgi:hypothetical protein
MFSTMLVIRIPHLESGLFNHFDTSVELPKFMMAAARIGEYLHSIKTHQNMRARKTSVSPCITHWKGLA